jgi:serine/threonine protein kinase
MIEDWPATTNSTLRELLAAQRCRVVREFGERRDSRSVVVGIECATGERYVVKHAEDAEAVAWLESALRFHADVRDPAIPTVVHHLTTATGLGLVEEWGPGEILSDGYDDAVLPPEHERSPYRRFVRLRVDERVDAVRQLIDAHVAVADAGYVAVDLYDGCVLYDFARHSVRLIDLDHYRPGPYLLDVGRQLGSSTYMAPEEFRRGATIDERTTVFTLGRMALVYLGCARKGVATRSDFRGTDEQFALAMRACATDPDDRIQRVSELLAGWRP